MKTKTTFFILRVGFYVSSVFWWAAFPAADAGAVLVVVFLSGFCFGMDTYSYLTYLVNRPLIEEYEARSKGSK